MPPRPIVAVALAVVAVALVPSGAQAHTSSIESEILSLINGGRRTRLAMHAGLREQARAHSRSMARRGGLTHAGAASRMHRAAPDPAERNGAPDDGYTGDWCENTGWVEGLDASSVAERMVAMWRRSSGHSRCMNDLSGLGTNAAGVGVVKKGDRWWVTLELTRDQTLPGSVTPGADRRPAAVATAVPTATPAPTATPEVEVSREPLAAFELIDMPVSTPAPPPREPPAETGMRDALGLSVLVGSGVVVVGWRRRRR